MDAAASIFLTEQRQGALRTVTVEEACHLSSCSLKTSLDFLICIEHWNGEEMNKDIQMCKPLLERSKPILVVCVDHKTPMLLDIAHQQTVNGEHQNPYLRGINHCQLAEGANVGLQPFQNGATLIHN